MDLVFFVHQLFVDLRVYSWL